MIVAFHVWVKTTPEWNGGIEVAPIDAFASRLWLGVTFFFVLSGFLLFRPYARAILHGGDWPSLRGYAVSRLMRIVPAYWVALAIVAPLAGAVTPLVLTNFAFAQNYAVGEFPVVIAAAWTLCVEVTFYAALPLIAGALRRVARGQPRRLLLLMLVPALGVGSATRLVMIPHQEFPAMLPGYIDLFAVGMALAVVLECGWRVPRPVLLAATTAALAQVVAHPKPTMSIGDPAVTVTYDAVMAFAFGLLLAAIATRRTAFDWSPVVWLGAVSYGLFLWHDPVLITLRAFVLPDATATTLGLNFLVVTAVALMFAAGSWRYVERPALRLAGRLREPRHPRARAAPQPVTS